MHRLTTSINVRRPWAILSVLLALVALAWAARADDVPPREEPPSARTSTSSVTVGPIGITVGDMDRAVSFYRDVLTFEPISDREFAGDQIERATGLFGVRVRVVELRLGNESIELREFLAPRGRRLPEDARANDLSFQHLAIIVSDMEQAYCRLRQHKVEHASPGPQRLPDWNREAGGIEAFYFRDPDGHYLEILHFPEDKGETRWHAADDRLFLGIDHTAIVVSDTERSLEFYQDQLGMRVVGTSENYGIEQERLNNVFGARLKITTLRGKSGPGVELLEYLTPRDGRSRPDGSRPNDLWHWQTHLRVTDLPSKMEHLLQHQVPVTDSAGLASNEETIRNREKGDVPRGTLIADPDGHVVHISQPFTE